MRYPTKQEMIAIIIAAIPCAMAIIPWDFGGQMYPARALMRSQSLPVIILESVVIMLLTGELMRSRGYFVTIGISVKYCIAALILVSTFTSLFVAVVPSLSVLGLYIWFIHILFGYAIYLYFMGTGYSQKLIWSAIGLGVLVYSGILYYYIVYNIGNDLDWIGLLPGMPHLRQLGYLSVVGFAASTAFVGQSRHQPSFWFGLAIASISFALAIWSGNRGSLIAIFAALCVAAWYKKELRTMQFGAWFLASLILGVALASMLVIPDESYGIDRIIASIYENYDSANKISSGRGEMWAGTINKILERPIFGYGEKQFQFVVPEALGGFRQPHNSILQYLLQWGIVGAGIFFFLIFQIILHLYKKTNRFVDIGQPEFLIIFSILIYSLYDGALYAPYSIAMLIFAIASALAATTQPAPAADK